MRRRTPETAPHCMNCGYLLYGLTENRCPECGTPFDPHQAPIENWEDDPLNSEDVLALQRERLMAIIGVILFIAGCGLCVMAFRLYRHLGTRTHDPALFPFVAPLVVYMIWKCDEPIKKPIFWFGLLSFGWGLLMYFSRL